ncbi:hypothetical protein Q3V37_02825 [Micromonospora profundi]|uniref:PPE family domain-containing protein n=1 Tax=Micromonospora profundi TaxID=1420889 RepID=A0AAJ6HY56_9ACTN|nr:hypothetical protein [Micromonospora profundi]WLS46239.1 hypothetical protein Q3V37_02825 [Micromonospora profundi]
MIERGSGRTSGLTDWQLMDVNSMWACLQDHDTTNHWKQVAGWRKVCDLAQIHLGRLQEYRRGLAEAWPPATSAASSTYLAQLDELIDKVRHTHDAAAANYTALSAATQAIGTTRAALRQVHEEYAAKLQQKQAFEEIAADPKAVMGNRATESPVTDAELERLNVRARAMMFSLSGELQQAQATLQKPPAVRHPIQSGDPDVLGTDVPAPVIPPIVPVPMPTVDRQTAPRPAASELTQAISRPQGIGPILGGSGANLGSSPTGLIPGTPASASPDAGQGPGLSPGTAVSSRPEVPPSPVQKLPGSTNRPQASPPSSQLRPAPLGGVIGNTHSLSPSPPAPGSPQSRKVNPIGGVIGGGAGTGPTGGAGSRPGIGRPSTGTQGGFIPAGGAPSLDRRSASGTPLPSGNQSRHRREDDHVRRWDADNPWETEEGVQPIVRPGIEQGPIDPGPAIGFNR